MDVGAFCAQSRVVVVAGKGGVGKTTVTAALARMASDAGLTALIVELEGKSGVSDAFGRRDPLTYTEATVYREPGASPDPAERRGGSVRARRLTPDDALLEYLADHGLQRVSKRLVSSGLVDVVATAIPGIRDVLVLGKIKQLERDRVADLIVVDAPATGHAVTFLTSAAGLVDAARGGPVRTQAADVVELLTDPARCRVLLVTLAEEMPVSETVEAAYTLEDRAGVQLAAVVVNGWDAVPPQLATEAAAAADAAGVHLAAEQLAAIDAARLFRLRRHELAAEQVDRLGRELPLPLLRLPEIPAPSIGPDELGVLSGALGGALGALGDQPVRA
jgi:anion-transporting  ArsA/GET3 family ATPase